MYYVDSAITIFLSRWKRKPFFFFLCLEEAMVLVRCKQTFAITIWACSYIVDMKQKISQQLQRWNSTDFSNKSHFVQPLVLFGDKSVTVNMTVIIQERKQFVVLNPGAYHGAFIVDTILQRWHTLPASLFQRLETWCQRAESFKDRLCKEKNQLISYYERKQHCLLPFKQSWRISSIILCAVTRKILWSGMKIFPPRNALFALNVRGCSSLLCKCVQSAGFWQKCFNKLTRDPPKHFAINYSTVAPFCKGLKTKIDFRHELYETIGAMKIFFGDPLRVSTTAFWNERHKLQRTIILVTHIKFS